MQIYLLDSHNPPARSIFSMAGLRQYADALSTNPHKRLRVPSYHLEKATELL